MKALCPVIAGAACIVPLVHTGDMNWTDSRDGSVPLLPGWQDAWVTTHPGDPGYTYDTKANPMLVGRWPGSRLDRWVVTGGDGAVAGTQ